MRGKRKGLAFIAVVCNESFQSGHLYLWWQTGGSIQAWIIDADRMDGICAVFPAAWDGH